MIHLAPPQQSPLMLFAYVDVSTPGERKCVGYHLGVGYLRAYLKAAGIPTDQLIATQAVSFRELLDEILASPAPTVGFSCYDYSYYLLARLSEEIKRADPGRVIVLGGPTATFSDAFVMEDCPAVDFCLRGESEDSLVALLGSLAGASDLSSVPALTYRSGSRLVRTEALPIHVSGSQAELDRLPSPYLTGMIPLSAGAATGVLSSRGCRYRCTYCNFAAVSQHTLRFHSEERLLEELALIQQSWVPGRFLHIHDDAFTDNPQRLKRICRSLIERGLNRVQYTCTGRIDHLDEECLSLMRDANIRPHFGIESASPRVLRNVCKVSPSPLPDGDCSRERRFLERLEEKVRLAQSLGLREMSTSIILGLPGETAQEGRESVEFVRRLGLGEYAHNFLRIYPGTRLFQDGDRCGIRIRKSPYGLPVSMGYAYDIAAVQPLPNAMQVRIARSRQEALSGLFTGSGAPAEGGHPWAVLFSDPLADGMAYREMLLSNLSLNTRCCFQAPSWPERDMEAFHTWVTGHRLVLPNPDFLSVETEAGGYPEGDVRLHDLMLRGAQDRWVFAPLARFLRRGHALSGPCAGVFLTSRNREDAEALEETLALPCFRLTFPSAAPVRFVDACRWGSAPCPAAGLPRCLVRQDAVHPCFSGGCVGGIHESSALWKQRMSSAIEVAERERGCIHCDLREQCSRCPFPGPWSGDEYCRLRKQHRQVTALLGLLEALPAIARHQYAVREEECSVTIVKGARPGFLFVLKEGQPALRYDGRKNSVDRLGQTFRLALESVAEGRGKWESVAEFARRAGASTQEAALLLDYLEHEYALPLGNREEELVSP